MENDKTEYKEGNNNDFINFIFSNKPKEESAVKLAEANINDIPINNWKFSRKKNVKSYFQKGKATYFSKISNKVSELNINKSIKNQINKIRTRDNKNFPACFYYKKRKYIIKLY